MVVGTSVHATGLSLVIDTAMRNRLSQAAADGVVCGLSIASSTPTPNAGTSTALAQSATHAFLPTDTSTRDELRWMHDLARTRTPDSIRAAVWLSDHATTEMIDSTLRDYALRVRPDQARRGAALVQAVVEYAGRLGKATKERIRRDRPFVTDPTLPVAVDRPPADNYSFPSGHATAAFAAATVLAQLMPDRRASLMESATQIAYARTFAAVHYPSDILAGAALGSAAATAAMAWHNANIPIPAPRIDEEAPVRAA